MTAPLKRCSCCGHVYTRAEWLRLRCLGASLNLDWRRCTCGTGMGVLLARLYAPAEARP